MNGALRFWRRLGWQGLLGAGMLAAAGWTAWSWVPAQRALADELGSQSRRLRHELIGKTAAQAGKDGHGAQGPTTPEQAWQALWQGLPEADRKVALQSGVLASATRHGVRVASVQYRGTSEAWSATGGQALWHQRMVMPIEGRYGAVRAWMAQMLQEPALAIDALEIERDDAGRDEVKGRIGVSLYWRQGAGGQR